MLLADEFRIAACSRLLVRGNVLPFRAGEGIGHSQCEIGISQMTSLAMRAGLPLAVLASVVLLTGCSGSSKSTAAQSNSGKANSSSALYQKECQAMRPIFSDPKMPAAAKDPEKIIAQFRSGPGWNALSGQQQTDAVAGIRKAATGSCH